MCGRVRTAQRNAGPLAQRSLPQLNKRQTAVTDTNTIGRRLVSE